ncbi:MAG TPA: CapA family protein [Bacteroidota bacterium]|nr:CapA family protein [Bacteroidota bacterium]
MERTHRTLTLLFVSAVCVCVVVSSTTNFRMRVTIGPHRAEPGYKATLLAFGDVNLGRAVGQTLLRLGAGHVFDKMTIDSADIVFVNLECPLSDQNGETESPLSNFIFTGPPIGASVLAAAGITHAATANNHAYDYGERALNETIDLLDRANVAHAGTAKQTAELFEPLCIERNGIRFALFAVTDFMNLGREWRRHAASTDTALLFPKLRESARWADAVVVSVHGGDEYAERPSPRMTRFMRQCVDEGAKLVLGHHPHVPYGIDSLRDGYIVQSLGNFVFFQPQHEWTQASYGVLFEFFKTPAGTAIALKRIIPFEVGFQPARLDTGRVCNRIIARARQYSTISLKQIH